MFNLTLKCDFKNERRKNVWNNNKGKERIICLETRKRFLASIFSSLFDSCFPMNVLNEACMKMEC